MNVPDAVGVPVIVATFAVHDPVTPAGNPEKVAPVAPVVARVILVIAVLIQVVLLIPAAIVFRGFTLTVAVAVNERLQAPLLTLVRFKVVFEVTAFTVTLTVPPAPIVAVPDAAPVYVTVFPAVPVIVKMAFEPEQIGLLDVRVTAKGRGLGVVDLFAELLFVSESFEEVIVASFL